MSQIATDDINESHIQIDSPGRGVKFGTLAATKKSLQNSRPCSPNANFRSETVINNLKSAVIKEKKKMHKLKTLYIKELESKSEFENILKKCVEDVKDEITEIQKHSKKSMNSESLEKSDRARFVEKLIADEKILTLIYDKTFYGQTKRIEIPPELLKEDSDDDFVKF